MFGAFLFGVVLRAGRLNLDTLYMRTNRGSKFQLKLQRQFELRNRFQIYKSFLHQFKLFLNHDHDDNTGLFYNNFALHLPNATFFFPSTLFFRHLIPIVRNFGDYKRVRILPMLRRGFHEIFHNFSYDRIKRGAIRGHLYLFFRNDCTIARISLQPMNRVIRPIGTDNLRRLIVVFLGNVHLLKRSAEDGIHGLPFRLYVYNLRQCHRTLTMSFLGLNVQFGSFILSDGTLNLMLLGFLNRLHANVLSALVNLLNTSRQRHIDHTLLSIDFCTIRPLGSSKRLLRFSGLRYNFLYRITSSFCFPGVVIFPISLFEDAVPFKVSQARECTIRSRPTTRETSF